MRRISWSNVDINLNISQLITVCLTSFCSSRERCWTDRCECGSKAGSGSGRGHLRTRPWSYVFRSPTRCSWWWRWRPRLQPAHTANTQAEVAVLVPESVKHKHLHISIHKHWVKSKKVTALTSQSTDCARVRVLDPASVVAASLVW